MKLTERIAISLGLTHRYVIGLANSASHNYKGYSILKRRGGTRTIHHPSKALKAIQRWLVREVIAGLPVHRCAMAYAPGSRTITNAQTHAVSKFLLRMDFQDFFPSLKASDIRTYIELNPACFRGWGDIDITAFCAFCCRHAALPIGAPTSPRLSNALCYELDEQLSLLAARNAAVYTRYADDLFFSTVEPNLLSRVEGSIPALLDDLRCPEHLLINASKTRHSSRKGARRVTGITLGSDGHVHLGRAVKRRIRAMIYRLDGLAATERASLRGWIAYASGIDPDFVNSLINKYGLARVKQAQQGLTSAP